MARCPKCSGNREIECPKCRGRGENIGIFTTRCDRCNGRGWLRARSVQARGRSRINLGPSGLMRVAIGE